jgi:hypothetical protein
MGDLGSWAVTNLPVWMNTAEAAPTRPTAWYVKLHTGAPGAAGTANAATETTRQAAAISAAGLTNGSAITWTNVSTNETYSHVSIWSHETAGDCLWQGALAASVAVIAGDTFTIAIGALDLAVS